MQLADERKMVKYEDLRVECEIRGWQAKVWLAEVWNRGFTSGSLMTAFKLFETTIKKEPSC